MVLSIGVSLNPYLVLSGCALFIIKDLSEEVPDKVH